MSPRKNHDVSIASKSTNLDETVPPCEHCEKYFFYQHSTFNLFDALFLVISMATYLVDIVTDLIVCVKYFSAPEYFWGFLTLFFTLVPSIIVHVFSARWYLLDDDMTTSDWLLHVFQLGTLKRYVCVFQTGLEARRSHDSSDFELLYHQQSDVSMLRLFESFMESAPQLVLQLYIMVATNDENYFTGVSAAVSLMSLCWAIAAYSKAQRKMRIDKAHISWPGLVFQTIWRIGMVSSRIMSLVLFASIFKAFLFPVVAAHWLVMFLWVYQQDTDFCSTWPEERLFNVIISIIYIFCFFNLKEGSSRFRIVAFYSIILIEDTLLVVLWSLYSEPDNEYSTAGYSIVFGGFFVGILSMIIYYRCFHPSGRISLSTTVLKDIEKHCPHDHVYASPDSGCYGLDAEISPHRSPGNYSYASKENYQLNYSVTSDKSYAEDQSYNCCILATQRSVSDSCLLDLTTRKKKLTNHSCVNCFVHNELTYELGITFTDYRLNCTGFASVPADQYDAAKERALTSSTRTQDNLENNIESTDVHVNLQDYLDMTQGSSLQDMPDTSPASPGLMTRYEAEKIYLDILELQRPSVPSQRKLVFRSGEDVMQIKESNGTKPKKEIVESSSEMIRKRQKPYILWKLDKQRESKMEKGDENSGMAREPPRSNRRKNIPETNKGCSTEFENRLCSRSVRLSDDRVEYPGDFHHVAVGGSKEQDPTAPNSLNNDRNSESRPSPSYHLKGNPPADTLMMKDDQKTIQPKEKPLARSSLGHGRPQRSEAIPKRKHSFKSSGPCDTSSPRLKQSFVLSSTYEARPRRKHSFKSPSTCEASPRRKHSFKSALPTHSPSIYNKENSPAGSSLTYKENTKTTTQCVEVGKGIKKSPRTLRSPVLQEITSSNKLAYSPQLASKAPSAIGGKAVTCSPSVRSLQLSIFSPNKESPGNTEKKKGRRSLGKIPLNTVADKISMFTH